MKGNRAMSISIGSKKHINGNVLLCLNLTLVYFSLKLYRILSIKD